MDADGLYLYLYRYIILIYIDIYINREGEREREGEGYMDMIDITSCCVLYINKTRRREVMSRQ